MEQSQADTRSVVSGIDPQLLLGEQIYYLQGKSIQKKSRGHPGLLKTILFYLYPRHCRSPGQPDTGRS